MKKSIIIKLPKQIPKETMETKIINCLKKNPKLSVNKLGRKLFLNTGGGFSNVLLIMKERGIIDIIPCDCGYGKMVTLKK